MALTSYRVPAPIAILIRRRDIGEPLGTGLRHFQRGKIVSRFQHLHVSRRSLLHTEAFLTWEVSNNYLSTSRVRRSAARNCLHGGAQKVRGFSSRRRKSRNERARSTIHASPSGWIGRDKNENAMWRTRLDVSDVLNAR